MSRLDEVFWQRVQLPMAEDDCWIWKGAKAESIGGLMPLGTNGVSCPAHRWAFERFSGQAAVGRQVKHSCGNTLCVNPAHLYVGTRDARVIPLWKNKDVKGKFFARLSTGDNGCMLWTGKRDRAGYGKVCFEQKWFQAHRVSYCLANDMQFSELGDKFVCHRCDNPPCCNPEHLFLGTHAENMADKLAKGRTRGVSREKHHATKLSLEETHQLVADFRGGLTRYECASKYGISHGYVCKLIQRSKCA